MRFLASVLLSVFAMCVVAQAPAPAPATPAARQNIRLAEMREVWDLEVRVSLLRPRRRDTPLRELNISDNEIREIQAIAAKHAMSTMINISPVISGCSCEDGPLCTDQVYVVSQKPEGTAGLQLSRIRNAWVVGPVQAWFLRYEALLGRGREMDYDRFIGERRLLLLEFPRCVSSKDEDRDS